MVGFKFEESFHVVAVEAGVGSFANRNHGQEAVFFRVLVEVVDVVCLVRDQYAWWRCMIEQVESIGCVVSPDCANLHTQTLLRACVHQYRCLHRF